METENAIKEKAKELGFDLVGITSAKPLDNRHADYFDQWLGNGYAGKMQYLHRNKEKRFSPENLLKQAKSIICVGLNYRPAPSPDPSAQSLVNIANYALYDDYHPFIKQRLFILAQCINERLPNQSIRFKACVDSVPIAERALACRAGLGFIGKNHMLIHPKLGCQILLGLLVTTLELQSDTPLTINRCANCGQCIKACPTGALSEDGQFDARKCISYLTIEEPDDIPKQYHQNIGHRLFGCDACIKACPYEQNAPQCSNTDFPYHPEWNSFSPEQLLEFSDEEFTQTFKKSAFERLGLENLKRNAEICRQNVT